MCQNQGQQAYYRKSKSTLGEKHSLKPNNSNVELSDLRKSNNSKAFLRLFQTASGRYLFDLCVRAAACLSMRNDFRFLRYRLPATESRPRDRRTDSAFYAVTSTYLKEISIIWRKHKYTLLLAMETYPGRKDSLSGRIFQVK